MAGGLLSLLGLGQQQPMQAQTSMSQPQSQGLLGNISDPLIALPIAGALMQPGGFGQNLGQGFAMAGQGMAVRKKLAKEELQQNMTAKYLESQGADPSLVEMAKSGAGAEALQAWQQTREKPLDELRLKNEQLKYERLLKGDDGTPETFGLNPIYGQNEKNETVLGVVGNKGTFKPLNTPGFSPSSGIDKIDLGDRWGILDKRTGTITGYEPKNLAAAASQTAQGKGQGEAVVTYNSMASKMPGLEAVVKQLDDLSNNATYTLGGQLYNAGRKQLGMDPSEGAKARTEYISVVDNQILPLLRDTFGAAFTQKEGDTLRATLGDPDKSPQEKQIVLKAFIEQKRRDIEALARQSSMPAPQNGGGAVQPAPQGGGENDPLGIR